MSNSSHTLPLPKFEWIDIDSEITVFDQQGNHQSGAGVKVSQYLVTNRQYEAFVSAGGYQKDAFWGPHLQNEENLENGKRPAFARSHWPQPNRPKTDINWYEAMAFCDWLNKEVEVSKPSNQYVFSLPSTELYEFLHRGHPLFKKGPIDDVHRKTNIDRKLQQTSTVGLYTPSAETTKPSSIEGISDLMGNVWERCNGSNESTFAEEENRTGLRGGAWDFIRDYARGRDFVQPGFRNYYLGFRVCCWLPSNSEL
jgi:formylglycine-generating enzyme required for sulfatase activity